MDIIGKLERNQLSKKEIENIIKLNLNHNHIKKIPEWLSLLTNLQTLYLYDNQIKTILLT